MSTLHGSRRHREPRGPARATLTAALATTVLVAGCSIGGGQAPADGPRSDASESAAPDADVRIRPVPPAQWRRMVAVGMWRPGCPATRADLRRIEINHYTFTGEIRRGVLVVNRDVAQSVATIFTDLFEARFPIRKMRPVEVYRGDANASLSDDNTSAYNCRRLSQINAPPMESPHANGRAIDINPRENPWRDPRCNCWFPSAEYAARVEGPGVILRGGLVWRLFRRQGWVWQDIKVPDYMHFDTGYPSGPYSSPSK